MKAKSVLRCVGAALGTATVLSLGLATNAEALPTGCHVTEGWQPQVRYSECSGGTGWHRIGIRCVDRFDSSIVKHFYGDWVRPGQESRAVCNVIQWSLTHEWVDRKN